MKGRSIGTAVVAAAATAVLFAAPGHAQDAFEFRGAWVGSFEEQTEPERDLATRGNTGSAFGLSEGGGRERAIQGDGKFWCEGEWRLAFRGSNENLSGEGEVRQTCKAMRRPTWEPPVQLLVVDEDSFEYRDRGEGKDKELRFRFRIPDVKNGANELIRCDANGKYKPEDEVFEGTYSCRQDIRLQAPGTARHTMANNIRGTFELKRGG